MTQTTEHLTRKALSGEEVMNLGAALAQFHREHPGGRETPLNVKEQQVLARLLEPYHPTFQPISSVSKHASVKH